MRGAVIPHLSIKVFPTTFTLRRGYTVPRFMFLTSKGLGGTGRRGGNNNDFRRCFKEQNVLCFRRVWQRDFPQLG